MEHFGLSIHVQEQYCLSQKDAVLTKKQAKPNVFIDHLILRDLPIDPKTLIIMDQSIGIRTFKPKKIIPVKQVKNVFIFHSYA